MSSIRSGLPEGRSPVVLQVLASLEPGGSTRSAIDIARAVAEAGAASLIASAGGPLSGDLRRAGALPVELPLDSRSPFALRRCARRLARVRTSSRLLPSSSMEAT